MRPATALLLSGAGAALLCASGCFGPMYNPYGQYGGPGYSSYNYPGYGSPGMMGAPGTFQTQTPGPVYTPGTIDSGAGASPTPTYGTGGNAPAYNGSGSGVVPNPQDTPFYMPGQGPAGAGATNTPTAEEAIPFSAVDSPVDRQFAAAESTHADGPTLRPAGLSAVRPSSGDARYGFDGQSYGWLEGVVSYDPTDRTWNIVYNLDPQSEDQYAGHFTLAQSPLLRTFREGERVRLEGRVDQAEKDRFGKPVYFPQRIIRTAV